MYTLVPSNSIIFLLCLLHRSLGTFNDAEYNYAPDMLSFLLLPADGDMIIIKGEI